MAKKSMIEREKKRIKLHKKYALKRSILFGIDVGKLEDLVASLEISEFHVMFYVK